MPTNYPHGVSSWGIPLLQAGIPFGKFSKVFFCDPANGNDADDGLSPKTAVKNLAVAYAKTTANRNDVVFFIGGPTATYPTTTLTWAKDFTHLIGLSSPLPGIGQRCRVVGSADYDLTPVVTWSASGCICMNIQFYNGKDANTDSGCVLVSGNRNAFLNCFFAGMGHATPAARAGSYSLSVSGAENHFERCVIGLDTILRAAANADLVISGSKLTFYNCRVISMSDTQGHFAVKVVEPGGMLEFMDCLFMNRSVNWATTLTDAFNVAATTTYHIILRGDCQFVGFTGIADVVTRIYGAGTAPNAGMFISTQPTG